jgi:hypothetical protein
MQEEALTQKIIGGAFRVHNTLGAGFLEKVYENALSYCPGYPPIPGRAKTAVAG